LNEGQNTEAVGAIRQEPTTLNVDNEVSIRKASVTSISRIMVDSAVQKESEPLQEAE